MPAVTFDDVVKNPRTRDGKQYLKDVEFCESIVSALKVSFNDEKYLAAKVTGKSELSKLRGALRHFAEENEWGLSLRTTGDESDANGEFTVTFKAMVKRVVDNSTRKVRTRKGESRAEYLARVLQMHPRAKGEKEDVYAARIAAVTVAE